MAPFWFSWDENHENHSVTGPKFGIPQSVICENTVMNNALSLPLPRSPTGIIWQVLTSKDVISRLNEFALQGETRKVGHGRLHPSLHPVRVCPPLLSWINEFFHAILEVRLVARSGSIIIFMKEALVILAHHCAIVIRAAICFTCMQARKCVNNFVNTRTLSYFAMLTLYVCILRSSFIHMCSKEDDLLS